MSHLEVEGVVYDRAFYASDVFHYQHVVSAMRSRASWVGLARQFEISPQRLRQLDGILPPAALKVLARRVSEDTGSAADVVSGLGPWQFAQPLLARLDRRPTPNLLRTIKRTAGRRVAESAKGVELFQFVEGLGLSKLVQDPPLISVCERRHLHHEVLETDPGTVGSFPFRSTPDPLRDVLSQEYELSDRILVYSRIAKQSFIDRGFPSSKLVALPLGVPKPLPIHSKPRDRFKVGFVGRADAHKGLDVAVAAVTQLGPPYALYIAGPVTREVRSWLGKRQNVYHVGILDRLELRDFYSTCGALVFPSIESFGYAAIEALAHGAPTHIADSVGASEYLPPDTFNLLKGRDPTVWAAALADPPATITDSAAVARGTRQCIEELNWDSVGRLLSEFYGDLSRGASQ